VPFFPHRLRQFRTVLGQNQTEMGKLLGLDEDAYSMLERGTQSMLSEQQENFIRRFGKEVYAYIHGERDKVEYEGTLLKRETALGDGFEGLTHPAANLDFDLKEVDSLVTRYRDAGDKERDSIYKKLVLAYKSLEAENQKLRSENSQLKQALIDAKDMMIRKFLNKRR